MIRKDHFNKVTVKASGELRKWLEENQSQDASVWLISYKKSVPENYLSTSEILDELLCFGWIDGIRKKLDSDRTMQLISPRKAQHWTRTYKERAERLINEKKMHIAGFKSIQRSKESGMWNFMDDVDNLVIPKDLIESLKQYKGALIFFENINPSSKRFVLRWLKLSKTEKTRKNRIEKISKLSAKGEKLPGS